MSTIFNNLENISADNIVFLCGAGVSLDAPTNLPTVYSVINSLIEQCTLTNLVKGNEIKDKIWASVWRKANPVRYRFELLIDFIRRNYDPYLQISEIFSSPNYNSNHFFLANMIKKGATVITTNFDSCIENVLDNFDYHRYVFRGLSSDLPEKPSTQSALIKIHGSVDSQNHSSLIITLTSLAKTNNGFKNCSKWRRFILDAIKNKILIVFGYSGSDDFDITPLLLNSSPKKCFWIQFKNIDGLPVPAQNDDLRLSNLSLKKIRHISFYNGLLTKLGEVLLEHPLKSSDIVKPPAISIAEYISKFFPSPERKQELINTLLFHYDLHDEVIACNTKITTDLIFFQLLQAYYRKGNYTKIVELVKNVKPIRNKKFEELEPYLLPDILYHYSTALYLIGRIEESTETAKQMYEVAKATDDYFSQMNALTQLGAIHESSWKFNDAQKFYNKVLRIERKNPNVENHARANWGLANILSLAGLAEKAFAKYNKVYKVYENIGSNYVMAQLEYNLGVACLKMNKFNDATSYFKLAEEKYKDIIRDSSSAEKNLIYVSYGTAQAALKLRQFEKGKNKLSEIISYLDQCLGHPLYYEIVILYYYLTYLADGPIELKEVLITHYSLLNISIQPVNGNEKIALDILKQIHERLTLKNIKVQMVKIEDFYKIL